MAAAAGGDIECCVELIKAGCSINQVDLDGKSAGRFAMDAANEVVSRFLVNVTSVKGGGLQGALRLFASKEKELLSHEKLMIAYGGSSGECGGPDDEAGDSYLWRLPQPKNNNGNGNNSNNGDESSVGRDNAIMLHRNSSINQQTSNNKNNSIVSPMSNNGMVVSKASMLTSQSSIQSVTSTNSNGKREAFSIFIYVGILF